MPLFLDDNERTRSFKELLREYLIDPNPDIASELISFIDIMVKAGLEVIIQNIREMSVQIYTTPNMKSPSAKFTAFGSYWITTFQGLLTSIGVEDEKARIIFTEHLLESLNGQNQDMAELAAILFCVPLFYFRSEINSELVTVYQNANGHGRKLAIAFAILKVMSDPEPFEKEIYPRLPSTLSKQSLEEEYTNFHDQGFEIILAKVAVLDMRLSSFLMQVIILDIGFYGSSWKAIWPDWIREEEV